MITAVATPPRPPYVDGETRTARAGQVNVAVQRINGSAYRVSIRHASTGAEVGDLSRSYPTEGAAREAATTATVLFRAGLTVTEALDMQGARA